MSDTKAVDGLGWLVVDMQDGGTARFFPTEHEAQQGARELLRRTLEGFFETRRLDPVDGVYIARVEAHGAVAGFALKMVRRDESIATSVSSHEVTP